MAPNPNQTTIPTIKDETHHKMPVWEFPEDIVISGISGRFPESDNFDELTKNLFDGVDMITEDDRRWPVGLYGLPGRSGKIKDLSKFDSQFFGVHGKQANLMDPQARLLLELTYEAMVDAGVNPADYRDTRTGVYVGSCVSEVEEGLAQDVSKVSGYALTGCSRSMFANRISFTFDFHGPSYSMDTACSSSLLALQQAVLGIRSGQCDQAIVGGVNICLRPVTALQFNKLSMLSKDGSCKHMDAGANGYVRAEACATVFLQRKSKAKRIYATIVHAKTNTDGYKNEGITFPSSESQRQLMRSVCEEAGINPHDVSYVEAHGTGTKAGDPGELEAIAAVYAKDRPEPLKVGGVKSNLGHSEPASGLCSLAKVLVAFEHKSIPANLHINNLNTDIKPLREGTLHPVRENTPYDGTLAGVNSFGFGGVNVHAVVKRNDKELSKESFQIYDEVPRLVNFASRTEAGVHHFLDFVEQHPERVSREFLALANDVSKVLPSSGLNHRGYIILKDKADPEDAHQREAVRVPERRPLWFVYSGMGSQWNGMAQALMKVKIFRETMDRLAAILQPFGVDLIKLLTSEEKDVLESTVAPFVSIAAVQIGLTNILRACDIVPDGIIGHSVGELGCAYADGAFDERQMILSAYWRGKCVEMHKVEPGLMAAIGLGWQECQARCPPGVICACHNSEDSTTISGPYEITKKFVAQLAAEGIFAREVKSCGVAFHSPCVGPIGPSLLEKLRTVIPNKSPRSSKWISSSVPQSRWSEELAKYSAPEYYVNNLVSPVLFQEALVHVPKNAVLIEIAPHTLLQAILKRSLGSEATYLGLCKRNNNAANLDYLLQTFGKLYTLGWNPAIENLYPRVDYPVPRGTQSLSSLVQWDHSQSWLVTQYPEYFNPSASSDYVVKVNLAETEDEYLVGHKIDGRVIYPATGYLMLAWKMLAKVKGQFYDRIPVEFENVTIHRATILPKQGEVKFTIRMMETNGEFSISESGTIVASGRVYSPEEPDLLKLQHIIDERFAEPLAADAIELRPSDIYKELRVRGYDYGPTFRLIHDAVDNGYRGRVEYQGKWISFADNMLQLSILYSPSRALMLPVRIQSVRCDPAKLQEAAAAATETGKPTLLPVAFDRRLNVILAPGLEIRGLKANIAPRRQGAQNPLLESYQQILNHNHDLSISAADSEHLQSYERVLFTLAKQVATSQRLAQPVADLKPASESELNRYEAPPVSDFPIAYILREAQATGEQVSTLVSKHKFELGKDPIFSVSTHEHFIRPLLDLVAENSPKKINVIEFNESSLVYAPTVRNHLSNTNASVSYTLAHPQANKLTAEQTLNEEAVVNNFTLKSGATLPSANKNADLVVAAVQAVEVAQQVATISAAVKVGGFAMIITRSQPHPLEQWLQIAGTKAPADWEKKLQAEARANGLVSVASRGDAVYGRALLFRRRDLNQLQPTAQKVIEVSNSSYEWVEPLKQALAAEHPAGANVWLVNRGDEQSGLVGLVTCLKNEENGNRIRSISLPSSQAKSMKVDFTKEPFASILERDLVSNVFTLDGQASTYRHLTQMDVDHELTVQTSHAFLNVLTRGDLSSLRWFESPNKNFHANKNSDEFLAEVYYAPLNFRDIMLASGKLPPDALPGDLALEECILGLEFAGRQPDGQRVMGMVAAKGLATNVVINRRTDFIFPIPDEWTLEQAATVPVAYSTAYYALVVRGGLQPGESVLIHSGSGGVGQAAISICLSLGCEVFTTVGSRAKRDHLLAEFPQLSERNLANSRDTSFEQHVLRETGGRGVDLVLNSLSEEKLQASVRCLAQHGRFLEIGKYDLSQNNPIGMSAFLKNIAFHGILLDSLFVSKPRPGQKQISSPSVLAQKQMVEQLMREGIRTGAVRPLKSTVFEHDQSEEAFRFMSTGRHIGKVLLRIRPEEAQKVAVPRPVTVKAIARTEFTAEKSYVVVGGLGGFGLEMAEWMITRGARKIVLVSRSGAQSPYQHLRIKSLKAQLGNGLYVSNANVVTKTGCQQLLKEAQALGPIGGIFNLAMVLRDAMLPQQTPETFQQCAAPKVVATQLLSEMTLNLKPALDYFVVFSSTSCGRGNVGQSNYGFANSVMERIVEQRRRAGQAGMAVQWGAVGDVGVVLETLGDNETNIGGTLPQRIGSCLATLDRFLHCKYPVSSSIVPVEKASQGGSSSKKGLLESIANILGLKTTKGLNAKITLSELGLDSLMGVEVKQTLERDYDVILSLQEIRALSVAQLQEIGSGNAAQKAGTENEDQKSTLINEFSLRPTNEVMQRLNQVEAGKPVFVIPPIEADFSTVRPIIELLKRPAYGLNWVTELSKQKSIAAVAKHFVKTAAAVSGQSGSLDLIGYSMGAVIAFEMSLQTEVGTLVLLDGSPKQMKLMIEKYLNNLNLTDEREQKVEGLLHFLNQIISIDNAPLRAELLALDNQQAQVKKVAELIAENGGPKLSESELQYAIDSYSTKMYMLKDYEPGKKRQGDLMLLRAEETLIRSEEWASDYGLSEITRGETAVHTFKGNHKSFLTNNAGNIAELINQRL